MSKKNLILGGILVFLALSAYVIDGPFKKWKESVSQEKNFFSELKVGEIDKIELSKANVNYVFVKEVKNDAEKWRIDGTKGFYLSDDIKNGIIDALNESKAASLDVASENIDKKLEFQVDENSGTKIVLKKGDESLLSLIIGKNTSDFSGTYLSKLDNDKTYVIKTVALGSVFSRDDWYDKAMFASEADKIDSIRFQYPTREFTVEKKKKDGQEESEWVGTLPYAFRVDQKKILDIVELMTSLVAEKIPEQKFENTGLEKHSIIVQAKGGGLDNTLMIGADNGEGLYYAKKGDSDNIYLIKKEQKNMLDKKLWELR